MASWSGGYVTSVSYTAGAFREQMPNWLRLATLLVGQPPPPIDRPFRLAELGCGYGLSTVFSAATCPHAEFWGFDFNPAHIEGARRTVERVGLGNARFEERSFTDIARDDTMPMFDAIVLHGVWSWIDPAIQRDIVAFIGRRLTPGGLVYISYNTMSGWGSLLPLLPLMKMAAAPHARPDAGVAALWATIDRLREAKASIFSVHPTIEQRLTAMRAGNWRYVAHELLNDWSMPTDFAAVSAAMGEAKCVFVGSATLTDNIPYTSVPAGVQPLLQEFGGDVVMRETIRDLGAAQGFRRDLYRKGEAPVSGADLIREADRLILVPGGVPGREEFKIATSMGEVAGKPEIYGPVMRRLDQGPLPFQEIRRMPHLAQLSATDCLQMLSMMAAGHLAMPLLPFAPDDTARQAATRVNLEIGRRNARGENVSMLLSPATGLPVGFEPAVTLAVAALRSGVAARVDDVADWIAASLQAGGVSVQPDAKNPDADPRGVLTNAAERVLTVLNPTLVTLGIL